MTKKVLMVNEGSAILSGYGVYGSNLLKELHQNPKYEIAELSCYINPNDERMKDIPWKWYANLPSGEEENARYASNQYNVFGGWKFEDICLDFKPDIVIDIRDYWMLQHEAFSPAREYYNWVIMPTVDAVPQKQQWIDVYTTADAVLTYQDWSGEQLLKQSGGAIKWKGEAPPVASSEYFPMSLEDRHKLKKSLGFTPESKIVGTVMRNQRRKLYPYLFEHFRKFLDKTGRTDTYLYCHTSYPDNGWDIPQLLQDFGLSSKVYFTYICQHCKMVYPSTFQDALSVCKSCGTKAAGCSNVNIGAQESTMNNIINMFDIYVQYANSEGFGMPQVEAAACGVPIMATNYSAMEDIVKKLDGYPIEVKEFVYELETGCKRAIPDGDDFIDKLNTFMNIPTPLREAKRNKVRKAYTQNYSSWAKTAEKWASVFDELESRNKWSDPPKYHNPAKPSEKHQKMDNNDYARWLITDVLGRPDMANSHMESRLIRDLNYGVAIQGMSGLYYNEMAHTFHRHNYEAFNREIAYNQMVDLCNKRNLFEQKRIQNG